MKKFLSFKCLVEKLKSFENIASPNQKMAEPRKISKFQTQKPLSEKSKINSKFRLAEIPSSDWLKYFQTFSKHFQFNIEVYGISMYIHGI